MIKVKAEEIAKALNMEEKDLKHTERVADLCTRFMERLRVVGANVEECQNVDADIVSSAAWLHDAGKTVLSKENRKFHNKPEYAEKAAEGVLKKKRLDKSALEFDLDSALKVSSVHKGPFTPDKGLRMGSSILRISDKLDKFQKGKKDAQEKYENSLREIEEAFDVDGSEADKAAWEAFKTVCQELHRELTD